MNKREAGRLGGMQTYARHGREHMRQMGLKGGRPRSKTLSELQAAAAKKDKEVKEASGKTDSLSELLRLWRIKQAGGLALD